MNRAVPVFNGLVGLVGALFGSFLCISVTGAMWLYDHMGNFKTGNIKLKILVIANILMVILGLFIVGAGVSTALLLLQRYSAHTFFPLIDIWICDGHQGQFRPWGPIRTLGLRR